MLWEPVNWAINIAVKKAQENINKADSYAQEDVKFCQEYLEAARVAINGLRQEVQEIFVMARGIILKNQKKSNNCVIV